jgi:hypothetical protein
MDYRSDVDAVADIGVRRETKPLSGPCFKRALALGLVVYLITRCTMKTILIVFAELVLQMVFV